MEKALIIVESPTKIKTLKKFLGRGFEFASSVGHVRDLPKKGFGIDFDNDFEPTYEVLPDKKDVISKIKKAAKECDVVYLAPDPDREGEAIAWHITSILPKNTKYKRVTFNAITKDAVLEAIRTPREIDQSLVDAQQARRLLDRIVGYKISPILQRRISGRGSLSAGRVQSIALKLVVDREKEIEAFNPVEYWNLSSNLQSNKTNFDASLFKVAGSKIEKELVEGKDTCTIPDEKTALSLKGKLEKAKYHIESLDKKQKKRNPVAPFTTSTIQQEASRHYGFPAQRTMSIAQSLYEGIDMKKEGAEGLITYMRTDSVRVEPEAITEVRKLIKSKYGAKFLPEAPKKYSTKKSAQDAHEAIRPTNLNHPPEKVKAFLNVDQYKLYSLIWKRFVASQMNPAIYDTISCIIETDKDLTLKATGSQIKFKGFLAVYQEKDDSIDPNKDEALLPSLKVGDKLKLNHVDATQSFTKPPPRFTEASLVKELESCGVGRPSTYAAIMNKIQSRDYTTKDRLQIIPTELGKIIAQMLETHFKIVMDVSFTATMENDLDEIAESKKEWKLFLKQFWDTFIPVIEKAEKEAIVPKIETDIDCPECGEKLQKVWARGKYFYGCSQYPECAYTIPIEAYHFKKSDYADHVNWSQTCPKCDAPMTVRHGRFGAFMGCSNYPECNGIVNIAKKGDPHPDTLPDCPAIGCDGKIQQRRSRFGKPFISCSNYPDCDVIADTPEIMMKKYINHPKTAYVKKAGGGRGSMKPSKELAAVIGKESVTRGECTKKIWVYIKENDLQDEKNRRLIVPDEKLAKVFGNKEPLDMMKLAGVIGKHLGK